MIIKKFLNGIIKEDGFNLETSNNKIFLIGKPKKKIPIKLKLMTRSIEYKLLLFPDFYFGKGYVDGEILIENGTISEILDIALKISDEKTLALFQR